MTAGPENTPAAGASAEAQNPRSETGGVENIVQEIRDGLAQISARELELRQREQEFRRQFRDMRQAARHAATEEIAQTQQRLAQQAADLNAQAVELAAQRARLNEAANELHARQVELEQQRADLALRSQHARHEVESFRTSQARQQQALRGRIEVVRRKEDELRTRVQRAEDNIARQRAELARRSAALDARAAALAQAGEELARRQAASEQHATVGEQLAGELEAEQQRLAAERAAIEGERAELVQVARALEQQHRQMRAESEEIAQARTTLAAEEARAAQQGQQLSEREAALATAQAGLAAEQAALEEARQTQAEHEERLARQRAAVESAGQQNQREQERVRAEWNQLETATQSLDTERERLGELQEQAAVRQRALEAEWKRLGREQALLRERQQQLTDEIRAFGERRNLVSEQHAGLAAQREELVAAQAELERRGERLRAREATVASAEAKLAKTRNALEVELQALAAERARLAELDARLNSERAALAHSRATLEPGRQDLEAQRKTFAQRQQELEQRWQTWQDGQRQLALQLEEHAAARRAFESDQAQLAERTAALEEQKTALAAEFDRLVAWEAQLERREAELAEARHTTEATREQTRRGRDALHAAQQQLAAREADLRQAELATEVQRRELAQSAAARAAVDTDLAQRLAARETELAAARQELARRANVPTGAAATGPGGSQAVPRRVLIGALAGAVLAALTWLGTHPPEYRTQLRLKIERDGPVARPALAAHADRLRDPELLAAAPQAADWRAAWAAGRIWAGIADDDVVHLTLRGQTARADAALLEAAAAKYAADAAQHPPPGEFSAAAEDLRSRRAVLETNLRESRAAQAQTAAALGEVATDAERADAVALAEELEVQRADISAALETQRAELAALMSAEVPRGTVEPSAATEALKQDALYQEDRAEFRAVALQYRSELTVAMLLLEDPAKNLQKAFTDLNESLAEQQALDPPAELRAALESAAADVQSARQVLAPFIETWRNRVNTTQQMEVREDVVALIDAQNSAADAARRAADELTALTRQLGERIDALAPAGEGSTRAVVLAAMLRGAHAQLQSATQAFVAAAEKTALPANIQLDALDRKLRGLRTRITTRETALAEQLQLEADRIARDAHAADVSRRQEEVRRLERQREEAVTALMTALERVRDLDVRVRRRGALEIDAREREGEIAWLTRRIAELDDALARAQQDQGGPERITFAPATSAAVASSRATGATLAALFTFGAIWGVFGLLHLRGLSGGRRR